MTQHKLVVVGNGMVGQRFVDEMLDRDAGWKLTVFGDEPQPAYDRVALSSLFDGVTVDDLLLADPDHLSGRGVDLRLGTRICSIDRQRQVVTTSIGETVNYDHLVLATGSAPFVPPIPGADTQGCFVYRTIDDLHRIRCWADNPAVRSGVVIGGGLLGLEAANALRNLGLDTHVVEMADHLMPQQLDPSAAAMLERWVSDLGVVVHTGFATSAIESRDGVVASLTGNDGAQIVADIVVFSAGIRPRHSLAEEAGLDLGPRGGVVIDDLCVTSDPAISAIGEVACHNGRIHGLVGPGYAMAQVAAENICGGSATFAPGVAPTKLKLLGVGVATFGEPNGDPDNVERVEFNDPLAGVHRRVSIVDGVVRGGVCVGDTSGLAALSAAVGAAVCDVPVGALVVPPTGDTAAIGTDLPDTALLCSCNNVARGDVKAAVAGGAHDLGQIIACTKAGSGCGGCKPDVSILMREELERLGLDADPAICEHFDVTRQDLFDLIRFHRHDSWAAVVAAHGRGRGCEICRPVVASILASLSNGYILDGDQAALQDTNDHSLANMQRNGTYSVVPRVPGGEITPAQLIALGKIAEDFDLYTKITGGQRIDLFGARLHELPEIWRRVVDAGLESGHAYGKALRTVKSCVGDTWCRYGVQDSVSMAIRVERRYRGLRAPHKLKSAVSGCTRECAEAQSKDFGLIATESGWNLYLCGNGGRTPRHADLFAVDLTDEQVITYLDRFLMFYIRTADRLQRTAAWFEQLDGGLDHLRAVIIDDSLGICDELEADMARHVASYECEWTATLDDPRRLAHFVEVVNAPVDPATPVWITERGQRVPAAAGSAS